VNVYTKKSQWELPTAPAYPEPEHGAPAGPPPGYSGSTKPYNDTKANPYDTFPSSSTPNTDDDAKLAARLQAEEEARAGSSSRGAQQDYANTSMPSSYDQPLPPRETTRSKGGFLGKLLGGKLSSSSGSGQQYPQQSYNQGYARPQQPMYGGGGGYGGAPMQYGGYQQQGYGGGYGGGFGGGYQQRPAKSSGGIGTMGGAALGLGGGLIGGMLIEDAIQDHDQQEYQQGYGKSDPLWNPAISFHLLILTSRRCWPR
jgi:hypothetical protein